MKTKKSSTKQPRVFRASLEQTNGLSAFLDDLILGMSSPDGHFSAEAVEQAQMKIMPLLIDRSVKSLRDQNVQSGPASRDRGLRAIAKRGLSSNQE